MQQVLLERLLADAYFSRPAPKSTGRETFSDDWLDRALAGLALPPADVQATLAELTARSIADGLRVASRNGGPGRSRYRSQARPDLRRRRLECRPDGAPGARAAAIRGGHDRRGCGIAPEHVEAAGFAWLAHRYVCGLAGNLPAVTGARHPVPLGALYRGGLL